MTDECGNDDGNAYLINRFNHLTGAKIGLHILVTIAFKGSVFLLINAPLSDLLTKFHSLEHKIAIGR
jgi:hypothetical protein